MQITMSANLLRRALGISDEQTEYANNVRMRKLFAYSVCSGGHISSAQHTKWNPALGIEPTGVLTRRRCKQFAPSARMGTFRLLEHTKMNPTVGIEPRHSKSFHVVHVDLGFLRHPAAINALSSGAHGRRAKRKDMHKQRRRIR